MIMPNPIEQYNIQICSNIGIVSISPESRKLNNGQRPTITQKKAFIDGLLFHLTGKVDRTSSLSIENTQGQFLKDVSVNKGPPRIPIRTQR